MSSKDEQFIPYDCMWQLLMGDQVITLRLGRMEGSRNAEYVQGTTADGWESIAKVESSYAGAPSRDAAISLATMRVIYDVSGLEQWNDRADDIVSRWREWDFRKRKV